MANNMVLKYTNTEVWPVASGVVSGDPVTSINSTPGFAITSRGDATKSETVGPYTISGIASGGVGNASTEAVVATDGAFRYAVTGASASTTTNTLVYSVGAAGAAVTSLTLTASTNIPFGKIHRFIGEAGATECSVIVGRFVDAT